MKAKFAEFVAVRLLDTPVMSDAEEIIAATTSPDGNPDPSDGLLGEEISAEDAHAIARRLAGAFFSEAAGEENSDATDLDVPSSKPAAHDDIRMYVPDHEGWSPHIKRGIERWYCFTKTPGEDWFHQLVAGELFLMRGHEMLCLQCALRRGVITLDRLFWQHRANSRR